MGRYDDAASHYLIGFRLHEELGENPLARGDSLERLADVARITGDWPRAITHYTDAQKEFESVPDGWVGMTPLPATVVKYSPSSRARFSAPNARSITSLGVPATTSAADTPPSPGGGTCPLTR